jgi:hypothetical protein
MKLKLIGAAVLLCFATSVSRAATIALTNTDALNTTSFNTGLNWANGVAPIGGNAYQTATFRLRTPANTTPITFAGTSLEAQSGGGDNQQFYFGQRRGRYPYCTFRQHTRQHSGGKHHAERNRHVSIRP